MIGNFRSNIVPPIVILMVTAFHLPRFFASCLVTHLPTVVSFLIS